MYIMQSICHFYLLALALLLSRNMCDYDFSWGYDGNSKCRRASSVCLICLSSEFDVIHPGSKCITFSVASGGSESCCDIKIRKIRRRRWSADRIHMMSHLPLSSPLSTGWWTLVGHADVWKRLEWDALYLTSSISQTKTRRDKSDGQHPTDANQY